MRKVLLKKPASMKKSPPFKGGKKNLMQKKIDAHLDKKPEHESFSLKKLRKEAYNWKGRVEFYLNEGDWDKPYDKNKTKKLMQKRQLQGGALGSMIKKNQMKKQQMLKNKKLKEDNKGFEGTHKKGANLEVLKRGKNHKMADAFRDAHIKDRAALRKPGIEKDDLASIRKKKGG